MGDLLVSSSSCSTTTSRRRRRIKRKTTVFDESIIPDDIIIDILSRLPAKDVLVCRCVCTRWRDLTAARDFTDLQFRRSYPMLLKDLNGRMALIDRCWEPGRTRSKVHKVYKEYGVRYFSHNGLIVARGDEKALIIYNPIYRDVVVNIFPPVKTYERDMYGVFFHPVRKEYCTLWRITLSLQPLKVQYKILNLESNPIWRDIKNPCTQIERIFRISPVLTDKYLYWMIKPSLHFDTGHNLSDTTFDCNIMEYDITNEEFRVIPCPVPIRMKDGAFNVNLIVVDGVVTLVQVFPSNDSVKVDLWTLNGDSEEHLWACSNYVVSSQVCSGYGVPKAIAFWNGELVLRSDTGRLYFCNLKGGTYRNFGPMHVHAPHLTSLVSLRNCKSNIRMVEDD